MMRWCFEDPWCSDFSGDLKNAQTCVMQGALTSLEIWKNKFTNESWFTCKKIARPDQESSGAQCLALAKHSVVRVTINTAVTKRPCSISFHLSWHSANHSKSYKPATQVQRFWPQWRKCNVFFFELTRLGVWRLLCMEEKGCDQNQADQSHP